MTCKRKKKALIKSNTPLLKESNTYNNMSICSIATKADSHIILKSPPLPVFGISQRSVVKNQKTAADETKQISDKKKLANSF